MNVDKNNVHRASFGGLWQIFEGKYIEYLTYSLPKVTEENYVLENSTFKGR